MKFMTAFIIFKFAPAFVRCNNLYDTLLLLLPHKNGADLKKI